jgi:hypothetical protein
MAALREIGLRKAAKFGITTLALMPWRWLLVSGWMLVRNWLLYNDPTGVLLIGSTPNAYVAHPYSKVGALWAMLFSQATQPVDGAFAARGSFVAQQPVIDRLEVLITIPPTAAGILSRLISAPTPARKCG